MGGSVWARSILQTCCLACTGFEPVYTNQKISHRKLHFLASPEKLEAGSTFLLIMTYRDLRTLPLWMGVPMPIQLSSQPSLLSSQGNLLLIFFLPVMGQYCVPHLRAKQRVEVLERQFTTELQKVQCFQLYWRALGLVYSPSHFPLIIYHTQNLLKTSGTF